MKNIQNKLIVLLFIALAFPQFGSSQDYSPNELSYGVYTVYPPLSNPKEKVNEAQTLIDLNRYYRPSWVREYISVEILTCYKGNIRKAVSNNDTLSQEQKDIINMADLGTDISVKVQYMPENNLKHNDIKDFNFTFAVDPEIEAEYADGQQQLNQYIKDNAIDKISPTSFKQYQLAVVKFTIDEEGHVIDPHVLWTSEDEKIDEILLNTISNMSDWQPAEHANGTKVKQEFVLTVGDMQSCVVNLLNIRQE